MTQGLQRIYGRNDLHFITCSCFRRQKLLDTPSRKNLFLEELERLRESKGFRVEGYVLMPEHFHLLISEPSKGNPSTVMQLLKQRTAAKFNRERKVPVGTTFWQARFYDFNVYTHEREWKRYSTFTTTGDASLVDDPLDWAWSSCRFYRNNEPGPVVIEFTE